MPNISARLVDDDGKDVEEGKPGEVLIKGPVVTKGYYGNSEATKGAFTEDGWFCTGDIAIWKNGLPYVVDRKKANIQFTPILPSIKLLAHTNTTTVGINKIQRPPSCSRGT